MHIAYQVLGEGPLDLVYIPGLLQHVELAWETPHQPKFLRRLGSLGRLIRFDKRGTGMSDRDLGFPTLETRMDDIRAVMDAVDSEEAVLIGLLRRRCARGAVCGHLSGADRRARSLQRTAALRPQPGTSVARDASPV